MTHALRRAEAALLHWFFAPASVAPLAAIRIALGAILVLSVVQAVPHIEWVWGGDGLLRHATQSYPSHPMVGHAPLVFGTLALSAACFSVGLATRVSGLVAAGAQATIASAGLWHSWGWTNAIPVFVAIVAVSSARNMASVDAWWARRRGRPLPTVTPRWAVRVLQVHVAVVYIAAGWHRIDDRGWIAGEMVYAAVANSMYTRLPYIDPQPLKPLFSLLTWATEALELAAPILLWARRTRVPTVLALMALHLGLELSAIIGWWQYMMLAMLVVFLPSAWPERVLAPRPSQTPTPRAVAG